MLFLFLCNSFFVLDASHRRYHIVARIIKKITGAMFVAVTLLGLVALEQE